MIVNYNLATEKAYETLIYNDIILPVDLYTLKIPNYDLKIISMQEYAKITGVSINNLTQNGYFNDGYTVFDDGTPRVAILYNEEIENVFRKRFTIAHEIGHISLHHASHTKENECEADTFAAQLLLPHCVLERLIYNGKKVSQQYLNEKFGLSLKAAKISLSHVGKKMEKNGKTEYEDIILKMNGYFIRKECSRSRYFYSDEDDEKNKIRQDWLYE